MKVGLIVPSAMGSQGLVVQGEGNPVGNVPQVGDLGTPPNTAAIWDYMGGDLQSHMGLGLGGYACGAGNYNPGV